RQQSYPATKINVSKSNIESTHQAKKHRHAQEARFAYQILQKSGLFRSPSLTSIGNSDAVSFGARISRRAFWVNAKKPGRARAVNTPEIQQRAKEPKYKRES